MSITGEVFNKARFAAGSSGYDLAGSSYMGMRYRVGYQRQGTRKTYLFDGKQTTTDGLAGYLENNVLMRLTGAEKVLDLYQQQGNQRLAQRLRKE